jgi:hypothetical protein
MNYTKGEWSDATRSITMQRVNKKVFETVQRLKGYKPYRNGYSIDFSTGKLYRVWRFHELPLEYLELVKPKKEVKGK